MALTVTLRASAMRTALPSGSRRAALITVGAPALMRSTTTPTGFLNSMTKILPDNRVLLSTISSRRNTSRVKSASLTTLTSPLTASSARAGAAAIADNKASATA